MLRRCIFFVSLFVFIITFLINLVLLFNPKMPSESLEAVMSVMLIFTVVALFICRSPNWNFVDLGKDSYWTRVFFDYGLSAYCIFVALVTLYYDFFRYSNNIYFSKSLGLAALLLLFSGIVVRLSYHKTRDLQ